MIKSHWQPWKFIVTINYLLSNAKFTSLVSLKSRKTLFSFQCLMSMFFLCLQMSAIDQMAAHDAKQFPAKLEFNKTRCPDHGIVAKTVHKTVPDGPRVRRVMVSLIPEPKPNENLVLSKEQATGKVIVAKASWTHLLGIVLGKQQHENKQIFFWNLLICV